MASRESQGLQATLIVLIMLVVALMVTSYVFFRQADEAKRQAAAAEDKSSKTKQLYDDENFKVQYMKHVIGSAMVTPAEFDRLRQGVSGDADMKKIDDDFTRFKDTFGQGLPAGQEFSLLSLPDILTSALRAKHEAVTDRSAELVRVTKETETLIQKEKEATQVAVDSQKKASDDLLAQTDDFEKRRQALEQQQTSQKTTFEKMQGSLKKDLDREKTEKVSMEKTVNQQKAAIRDRDERIRQIEKISFDVAHGRVVMVNQRTGTVWINLGKAEGLRRQTTFSVYDEETSNFEKASPKGSIEVTQVLDQHLAEARVTQDDVRNPLLPGDQVFSPTWRPGRKVRFAIAGNIDVNGDGVSDRELVRTLISLNDGIIDAELHDDGEIVGKVSAETRYLLLGETPTERSTAKYRASYSNIFDQAKNLGVERITVDELLAMMGWKAELRTTNLGRGKSADEYGTRPSGAAQPAGAKAGEPPVAPAPGAAPAAPAPAAPAPAAPPAESDDPFAERTPPQGADGAF